MTHARQLQAAQRHFDAMSPPEPTDMIEGQVDLYDAESIADFIGGDDDLAEAIREPSVAMLANWMRGPKDSYAIDALIESVNRMAWKVEEAAEAHNAAIEECERDIAAEARAEAA